MSAEATMLKEIQTELSNKFSDQAATYAINRFLQQEPDSIRSPLYWCLSVAQNWTEEQKNWRSCGECDRGWVWDDDLLNTVRHCRCHPAYGVER